MEEKRKSQLLFVGMILLFLLVICIGGYFAIRQYLIENPSLLNQENQAETQNPPPLTDSTENWNMISNTTYGFSFKYPNNFFDASQQPKVLVGTCNDTVFPGECPDITNTVSQDQNAKGNYDNKATPSKLTINGVDYCQIKISDAAAGQVHTSYYYTTVKNQKCIVVYMEMSQTRCENYLPLEVGNTQQEKNYNDCIAKNASQPATLQQIINTFTVTK